MISVNEKCVYLIELLEKLLKEYEKSIPFVYRGMVKSLTTTIKAFISMTSEDTIEELAQRLMLLHEAIFTAEYASKQDFMTSLEELQHTWT